MLLIDAYLLRGFSIMHIELRLLHLTDRIAVRAYDRSAKAIDASTMY